MGGSVVLTLQYGWTLWQYIIVFYYIVNLLGSHSVEHSNGHAVLIHTFYSHVLEVLEASFGCL